MMSRKRKRLSNAYYRVKKSRFMRNYMFDTDWEETDNDSNSNASAVDEVVEVNDISVDQSEPQTSFGDALNDLTESSSGSFQIELVNNQQKNENLIHPQSDVLQQTSVEPTDFHSKIVQWVTNNIGHLPSTTITELLQILRSEGYSMFPPTAHALLGCKHSINSQSILTKNGSYGQYVYLGILNGLEKRISPEIFTERSIRIMVFIDGMKIYKNSKGQLWPIVIQLHDSKYSCTPFTAGLFYGEAKPCNVEDILNDFVEEIRVLTTNGVTIKGVAFNFKLTALIADGQARAYLKCLKGPTAYFGCERCTVRGVTAQKKRIYPEINRERRTKESFINKTQPEHHQDNMTSPLIKMPDFDPVKDVILDSMHLLFLGVMKNLLVKWCEIGSPFRLHLHKRQTFKNLMDSITAYVPKDFQRKIFDITEVSHWKATQYRFILLYVGPIILKFVLDSDRYKHFLLLHVACRILCSPELAVKYVDYADKSLKNFFKLMPRFYGEASQIMNLHNLIHIADDVRHLQAPLNDFSAFWGESYIGKLKKLVQSAAKPLPQIVNRLHAIDFLDNVSIEKKCVLGEYDIDQSGEIIEDNGRQMVSVNYLKIYDLFISSNPPNNIVQLKCAKIFLISSILSINTGNSKVHELDDFYIEGFEASMIENVFVNPCQSIEVDSMKIREFSGKRKRLSIKQIKSKCVSLQINETKYAVSLLHST